MVHLEGMLSLSLCYHMLGILYIVNTVHLTMKERPTKCIFNVDHIFRISILLLHVSALQERQLQGA
jgi:hypothetical protein